MMNLTIKKKLYSLLGFLALVSGNHYMLATNTAAGAADAETKAETPKVQTFTVNIVAKDKRGAGIESTNGNYDALKDNNVIIEIKNVKKGTCLGEATNIGHDVFVADNNGDAIPNGRLVPINDNHNFVLKKGTPVKDLKVKVKLVFDDGKKALEKEYDGYDELTHADLFYMINKDYDKSFKSDRLDGAKCYVEGDDNKADFLPNGNTKLINALDKTKTQIFEIKKLDRDNFWKRAINCLFFSWKGWVFWAVIIVAAIGAGIYMFADSLGLTGESEEDEA